MFRPEIEEITCPCGRTFIRKNWRDIKTKYRANKIGRPTIYCESCREAYLHGRPYGKSIVNGGEVEDDWL